MGFLFFFPHPRLEPKIRRFVHGRFRFLFAVSLVLVTVGLGLTFLGGTSVLFVILFDRKVRIPGQTADVRFYIVFLGHFSRLRCPMMIEVLVIAFYVILNTTAEVATGTLFLILHSVDSIIFQQRTAVIIPGGTFLCFMWSYVACRSVISFIATALTLSMHFPFWIAVGFGNHLVVGR